MRVSESSARILVGGLVFFGTWAIMILLLTTVAYTIFNEPWLSFWSFSAPKRIGPILGVGLVWAIGVLVVFLHQTRMDTVIDKRVRGNKRSLEH